MRFPFLFLAVPALLAAAEPLSKLPPDPKQGDERTCFQVGGVWESAANLPADVAIAYGIDPSLPDRVKSWQEHGFGVHLMTGVAWGQYQDYLFGKFDGRNHEDEAQVDRDGKKLDHGGSQNVYYMSPSISYGRMLCAGIQRGLDAGVTAIHLEEPEYFSKGGYSESFKREWQAYYGEPWQAEDSTVDARWKSSKLKYFLYRRTLQQVFDYVGEFNQRTGKKVQCYVATHSLINYASGGVVSPESSLAQLKGCDGYIAQVWTDTERFANRYKNIFRERIFETGFLEYGAMQNLVRSTGRRVWYLADPVEDDPRFTWKEYRQCWETTIVASLLQPDVWRYEVAPWPQRIFLMNYPSEKDHNVKERIPPAYATELQTVMRTLNDMNQPEVSWDCGTPGFGVLISDSLMFQRGDPQGSDNEMGHLFGLAIPLVEHGLPVTPVQLENVILKDYLAPFHVLFLSYQGMKPMSPEVNTALADWVKGGGVLVVWDDDSDPYNAVREWWNTGAMHYTAPREHLFDQLGLPKRPLVSDQQARPNRVGEGTVFWVRQNPVEVAHDPAGDGKVTAIAKAAAQRAHLPWKESSSLVLRRGPYLIASSPDETPVPGMKELRGRFINLFDAELPILRSAKITPGSRWFLLDLDHLKLQQPSVLAASGFARPIRQSARELTLGVEGVGGTPGILLVYAPTAPQAATLDGQPLETKDYSSSDHVLRLRYTNSEKPRELSVRF